jgi:hypothetical protein
MSKAAELANLIGNINAGGGGVNRNLLINSAMNVSQRGTSQAFAHDGTTNAYLIDRWRFAMNNTDELDGTFTQVADDPLGGGGYALKWTTGTAESAIASNEYGYFTQKIEAQNLQHIQNGNSNAKSLTLSFYVKSSITGTFSVGLYKPDNTARQNNRTYTINSANTWEKKSVTFEGDTSGGGINNDNGEGIWVSWNLFAGSDFKGGGSTSGWVNYANSMWADGLATDAVMTTAGATWFLTQCQLEIGQNPTSFEHEPFERTLAKCYRYFYIKGGTNYAMYGQGRATSTTRVRGIVQHLATMRSAPSFSATNVSDISVEGNAVSSISTDQATTINIALHADVSSGLTTGQIYRVYDDGASNSRVSFDSEL